MGGEAEALLARPRGRELCVRLAARWSSGVQQCWRFADHYDEVEVASADLAAALRAFDPVVLESAPQYSLLDPVAASVCSAMYWEEPFAREDLLTDRQVLDALLPITAAVLRSTGSRWWYEPMPRDRQYVVC